MRLIHRVLFSAAETEYIWQLVFEDLARELKYLLGARHAPERGWDVDPGTGFVSAWGQGESGPGRNMKGAAEEDEAILTDFELIEHAQDVRDGPL
ncbi:hypothetical protein B0H12DRAFT_1246200 [Mycena haematopus]|nr:hypothetical protein B0H12DRAFT_1246200 [Mycena haematopus]